MPRRCTRTALANTHKHPPPLAARTPTRTHDSDARADPLLPHDRYTIKKMKNRKLKFGLFIGSGAILGFGIPFWAVNFTQKKLQG